MKNVLLVSTSILVLLLAALLILATRFKAPQPSSSALVSNDVGMVNAIVMDLNGRNDLTLENLLSGQHVTLVLNVKTLSNQVAREFQINKNSDMYVFNDLQSLARFDVNHDGRVDPSDPIYPALEWARFNNGRISSRVSVYTVGVRAIKFNPDYLTLEMADDYSRFNLIAATGIMSDSSTRVVKVIPVSTEVFQ